MILLAEAVPTSNALLQFLLCVSFLVSIAAGISTVIGRRQAQNRIVTFPPTAPSKEEFQLEQAENKRRFEKLEGQFQELMRGGEERAVNLHNRLNPVAENVANIKGSMEAFTQSFENLTHLLVTTREKK